MSDTPMTDKEIIMMCHVPGVSIEFARQLERDLATANARIAFLETVEGGQVEAENVRLKGEIAEAKRESGYDQRNAAMSQKESAKLLSELAEKDKQILAMKDLKQLFAQVLEYSAPVSGDCGSLYGCAIPDELWRCCKLLLSERGAV
jgi:hypothetical protein